MRTRPNAGASLARWRSGRAVGLISPEGNRLRLFTLCAGCVPSHGPELRKLSVLRHALCPGRASCSCAGAEGTVARTALWKVLSEWKFLFPLSQRVVGEDSYPARKETTSKQLEHPISTQQTFIMHLARVRPARPFPSVLQSNVHTGSATMKQRRKLRPKEVERLDTDQA